MAIVNVLRDYSVKQLLHYWLWFYIFTINGALFGCGVSGTVSNYEGSECSLGQTRNYPGICRRIQNCPAAVSNLHAGQYPVNCLYVGGNRTPLVCCEKDPANRISMQKCIEYEDIAKRNEKVDSAPPSFLLPSNIPSKEKSNDDGWGPGTWEGSEATQYVVGGDNARVGQFPYMVALGFSKSVSGGIRPSSPTSGISWLCGGTLISEMHVLTAGHCLQEVRGKGKPSFILVGDVLLHHNQSEVHTGLAAESRRIIAIKDFVIHPRYNSSSSKYNDIGIITLKEKVVFSRNAKPACLPQPEYRLENRNVPLTATGWGLTEFAGSPSDALQFVELKRQTFQACGAAYSDGSMKIIPSQFCAGAGPDDDVPRDTCEGDSGSGLTMKVTSSNVTIRFVVGITSFGSKYCGFDKPGVYTNVQSFLDWIEDIVFPINS